MFQKVRPHHSEKQWFSKGHCDAASQRALCSVSLRGGEREGSDQSLEMCCFEGCRGLPGLTPAFSSLPEVWGLRHKPPQSPPSCGGRESCDSVPLLVWHTGNWKWIAISNFTFSAVWELCGVWHCTTLPLGNCCKLGDPSNHPSYYFGAFPTSLHTQWFKLSLIV